MAASREERPVWEDEGRLADAVGTPRSVPLNYAAHFWHHTREVPGYVPALVSCEHAAEATPYRVLLLYVARLALHLRAEFGVRGGRPVAVLMEKSEGYVAAVLAVLAAGGSFVPLTPSDPPSLRARVVRDCGVACVVVDRDAHVEVADAALLPVPARVPPSGRLHERSGGAWRGVDTAGGGGGGGGAVHADDSDERVLAAAREIAQGVPPQQQACVVYSSGTTGNPKGICIPHVAMVACYLWRFGITRPKRWGGSRVACNVFFVWEILRPFLRGATCVVVPDRVVFDPPALLRALREHRITEWLSTPSLMESVLSTTREAEVGEALRTVRALLFNGEVVRPDLARRTLAALRCGGNAKARLFNLYSISECHEVSMREITPELLDALPPDASAVPVGETMPLARAVVLRAEDGVVLPQHEEVPEGEVGRLHIAGVGLALGYHGQEELTRERFFAMERYGRVYDTGDVVRVVGNQIHVLGRGDSMTKVRGYSVVLGAVEAMINRCLGLKQCCVVAEGAEGTDKRLVAYLVLDSPEKRQDWPVDARTGMCPEAHAALKHHLPLSHVPSCYVAIDVLPVHAVSGKTNFKALPPPPPRRVAAPAELDQPLSQRSVGGMCALFAEVLALPVEAVTPADDFFALGGHSLLAAKLVARLKRSEWASEELRVADVFVHPSPEALFAYVAPRSEGGDGTGGEDPEVRARQEAQDAQQFREDLEWVRAELKSIYGAGSGGGGGGQRATVDALGGTAVLVTGASGFVGAEAVRWVRERHPDVPVLQLVRAAHTPVLPGCEALRGDLARPLLGLDEAQFDALRGRVGLVVHCGAAVNLVARYSSLRAVNVCGTMELLRLRRPLRFVSSSAAHPDAADGYGRTKFVAERMCAAARDEHGADVVMVRPADIAGPGAAHDHRFLTLRAVVESGGELPHVERWRWRAVHVREVVEALLEGDGSLPPPLVCSIAQVARWMRDAGYRMAESERAGAEGDAGAGAGDGVLSLEQWVQRMPREAPARTMHGRGVLLGLLQAHDPHEVEGERTRPYPRELFDEELLAVRTRRLMPPPLPLTGHVAVVTGASSGIGAAIARRLLEAGARVMLLSRRALAPEGAVRGYAAGADYEVASCDVRDADAVQRAMLKCARRLGAPTVVVNNAGVMYYTLMRNARLNEWRTTIDTVCHGAANVVHAALPYLLARRTPGMAHVVSITSDAGRRPFAGLAVYSGAKHFVEAMTGAMRLEFAADPLAQHVRITNVQPGNVGTPLLGMSSDKEALEQYGGGTPGCKVLEPDDVARAVLYALTQPSYCAVNELLVEPRLEPI